MSAIVVAEIFGCGLFRRRGAESGDQEERLI